jgi:hypothetical protein
MSAFGVGDIVRVYMDKLTTGVPRVGIIKNVVGKTFTIVIDNDDVHDVPLNNIRKGVEVTVNDKPATALHKNKDNTYNVEFKDGTTAKVTEDEMKGGKRHGKRTRKSRKSKSKSRRRR